MRVDEAEVSYRSGGTRNLREVAKYSPPIYHRIHHPFRRSVNRAFTTNHPLTLPCLRCLRDIVLFQINRPPLRANYSCYQLRNANYSSPSNGKIERETLAESPFESPSPNDPRERIAPRQQSCGGERVENSALGVPLKAELGRCFAFFFF